MVQCAFSYATMCEAALSRGIGALESTAAAAMPRMRVAGAAASSRAATVAARVQATLAHVQATLSSAERASWLQHVMEARAFVACFTLSAQA